MNPARHRIRFIPPAGPASFTAPRLRDENDAAAVAEHIIAAVIRAAAAGAALPAIRHPLGFTCLPLLRRGRVGICIHLWTWSIAARTPVTSAVHCHSWDLDSLVLSGFLRQIPVEVANAPGDVEAASARRVFEVVSAGEVDDIRWTPQLVTCRPGPGRLLGPGQRYRLPAGAYHATEASPAGAITLSFGFWQPGGRDRSVGPPTFRGRREVRGYCDPDESTLAIRTVTPHLLDLGWRRLVDWLEGTREPIPR